MRLNGWVRLWIVATLAWFAYVAYWLLTNISPARTWDGDLIRSVLLAALAPPVLVLGIGLGIAWIRRGFRA